MWRRQSAGSNVINDPHWLKTIQYSILIGYLNREFFSQKESDVFISVSSQTRFKKEKMGYNGYGNGGGGGYGGGYGGYGGGGGGYGGGYGGEFDINFLKIQRNLSIKNVNIVLCVIVSVP